MGYEEFAQEVELSKHRTLRIEDGILQYGNTTYPLRNISHVKIIQKELEENKSGWFIKLLAFIGGILVILGLIVLLVACSDGSGGAGVVSVVLIIIGGWIVSLQKKETHIFYGLAIETNSGSNELFFSEDEQFIKRVRDILSKALANSDVRTTIHIGDKNFIDNSVTNNQAEHHTHYNFNIEHHEGLSKEEKEFLLHDFKESVEKLYEELGSIKESQVTREQLDEIVKEINSEKPDVGKIKRAYEKIKSATEAYDTISSLGEFGKMVGQTVIMFMS